MGDRIGRVRGVAYALMAGVFALVMLSGCAPLPTVILPPQVPAGLGGAVLDASPDNLALTREDLPAGFRLAAEKASGPEYVAFYLRPAALEPQASGGNTLLSVVTSIGVYTTTVEAEQVYLKAISDPNSQATEEAALVSRAATGVVTEPYDGAVKGADAAQAVRTSYRLVGQNVYEYGHRFRVGNVLAYVVVAAVGSPDEPEQLLKSARDIVQRQIDHIAEASTEATPARSSR